MKYLNHLSLIMLLLVAYCFSSEFEYEDTINEIFHDYDYYPSLASSPEFQPNGPLSTTPKTIRISRRPARRIYNVNRNSRDNIDSITFPANPVKPSVRSIKIYQCGNFRMRCEFRPNYDVDYPLHCKMEWICWTKIKFIKISHGSLFEYSRRDFSCSMKYHSQLWRLAESSNLLQSNQTFQNPVYKYYTISQYCPHLSIWNIWG